MSQLAHIRMGVDGGAAAFRLGMFNSSTFSIYAATSSLTSNFGTQLFSLTTAGNATIAGTLTWSGNATQSSIGTLAFANGSVIQGASGGSLTLDRNGGSLYIYGPNFNSGGFTVSSGNTTWNNGSRILLNDTTVSTSTTTGALVVSGGVGISGAVYVGSRVESGSASSWPSNFSATGFRVYADATYGAVLAGYGTTGDLVLVNRVGNRAMYVASNATNVVFPDTTASTSTATGALVVSGGVGVAGMVTSGNIQNDGIYYFGSGVNQMSLSRTGVVATLQSTSTNSATFQILGGPTGPNQAILNLNNNSNASFSLFLDPSDAVFKDASVNYYIWRAKRGLTSSTGGLEVLTTTASTSTTTGALVVSGGVGVAGAIYVGGAIYPSGANTTLTASAASMIVGSNGSTRLYVDHGNTGWGRAQIIPQQTRTDIGAVLNNATTTQILGLNGSSVEILTASATLTATFASSGVTIVPETAQLTLGTTAGATASNRKTINFVAGGFAAPGAYLTDSYGDKLVLWRSASGTYDGAIGIGAAADMWFKSSGSGAQSGLFRWYNGNTPTLQMEMGTTGTLTLYGATASTSTTTGALVVSGGVGVAGAIYAGGDIWGNYAATGAIKFTTANNVGGLIGYSDAGTTTAWKALASGSFASLDFGTTVNKTLNLLVNNATQVAITTTGVTTTGNLTVSGGRIDTSGILTLRPGGVSDVKISRSSDDNVGLQLRATGSGNGYIRAGAASSATSIDSDDFSLRDYAQSVTFFRITSAGATFASNLTLSDTITSTSTSTPFTLQAVADASRGYFNFKGTSTYGGTEVYLDNGGAIGSTILFLRRSATNKSAWVNWGTATANKWRWGMDSDSTSNFYLYSDADGTYPIKVTPGAIGAGSVTLNNTTASTSTVSGALIVSGGAGIAGATYIGGLLNVGGSAITTAAISSLTTNTATSSQAYGLYQRYNFSPSALANTANFGLYSDLRLQGSNNNTNTTGSWAVYTDTGSSSTTGTHDTLGGIYASANGGTGLATYTNIYGLRAAAAKGTATATNLYGVYVDSVSGATNNYAIYTNTGLVRFGDTTEATTSGAGSLTTAGGIYAAKATVSNRWETVTSTTTYSATTDIDLTGSTSLTTITLTGNLTLTTSNRAAGRSKTIRIIGDGSIRNLTFPAGWVFVGSSAPSSIAANKTAILTITFFGSNDSDCVAAWAVQP